MLRTPGGLASNGQRWEEEYPAPEIDYGWTAKNNLQTNNCLVHLNTRTENECACLSLKKPPARRYWKGYVEMTKGWDTEPYRYILKG